MMTLEDALTEFANRVDSDYETVKEEGLKLVDEEEIIDHFAFVSPNLDEVSFSAFEKDHSRALSKPAVIKGEFYILTNEHIMSYEVVEGGIRANILTLDSVIGLSLEKGDNIYIVSLMRPNDVRFLIWGLPNQENALFQFTDNLKEQWIQN